MNCHLHEEFLCCAHRCGGAEGGCCIKGFVETFQKSLQRAGELWLFWALKRAEDPDGPNYQKQRGQVRNPGRGGTGGFWRYSWEEGWSRLALASCMAGATRVVRATLEQQQCWQCTHVQGDAGVGRQEEAQRQARDESAVPADD